MMNDLYRENQDLLNQEQAQIINSSERKIIVSAGPGSGKTYTIVARIAKELLCLPEYRGVIACSFTKESSKQLKSKLENATDTKSSFIGTIDSFVFSVIIDAYKNRFLHSINKSPVDKLRIVFPEIKSEANDLTKVGINDKTKGDLKNYYLKWLENFSHGIYEISFPTYRLASEMIIVLEEVRNYLNNKFETIYIDEAQDMNEFQYMFLDILINRCNMKCVLVGDKNQSIYQFRGARPELFYKQKENGFTEYRITVSLRCHKSILDFSNLIVDPNHIFTKNDVVKVSIDVKPTKQVIESIEGNFLVLCETNGDSNGIYTELSQQVDNIIYTQPILTKDKSFNDEYLEYLEEIVKFYLNFSNVEPSLTYSIEDFKLIFSSTIEQRNFKDSVLDPSGNSLVDYVFRMFELLRVDIEPTTKVEITEILQNNLYINHYKRYKNMNRVMTIHASKGLEADNVFVVLGKFYRLDDEYRRKLFVSFSRAKNNLFISYLEHSNINGSTIDSLIRDNINSL